MAEEKFKYAPAPLPGMSVTAVITIFIGLAAAVLAAFWQLSDPRADIKDIRVNYLTVREHTEFLNRILKDTERLEQENQKQLSIETFNAWKTERDGVIASMQHRLQETVTKDELKNVTVERRSELDKLRADIKDLENKLHEHERDDRFGLNGKK